MPDTPKRVHATAKYPDLDKIEWIPEYMIPEQRRKLTTVVACIVEPFILKLQEKPGMWAIYATGRKSSFHPRRIVDHSLRTYTQVKNRSDPDTGLWTTYMRWTGGNMNPEAEDG